MTAIVWTPWRSLITNVETTRCRAFLLFTVPHPHSKVKPQSVQLPHLRKSYGFPRCGFLAYQVWEFLPCSQILRSKIESVWHPKKYAAFFLQRSFQQPRTNLPLWPVLQGNDWIGGFRHLPDFGLIQEIALERKTHWDSGGWAAWLGHP